MKNQKPKISICIPTFNRCELFEKTLSSVIGQTRKPYEVIVVDNHSTDATPNIVRKYKKYGIKYHRNDKNIGFVGNWNKCIDYATGDYLTILHADDLISHDWYEKWEKVIKENPDTDGFFSAWALINLEDKVTTIYHPFNSDRKFLTNEALKEICKSNLLGLVVSGGLILKKEIFNPDKIGKFDESLGTETDINMYFPLIANYKLYYKNEVLFGYRIHPFQTMDKEDVKKSDGKIIQSTETFFRYIKKYYHKEIVRLFGDYKIFYKKLIVSYRYKALLKLLSGKTDTARKLNQVINNTFPKAISFWDYYLYPYMGLVYIKRIIVGKILSWFYPNLFKKENYLHV